MMNCFAYDKLTTDGRQRKEKKSLIGTYLSANWLTQKVCYEIHENTLNYEIPVQCVRGSNRILYDLQMNVYKRVNVCIRSTDKQTRIL